MLLMLILCKHAIYPFEQLLRHLTINHCMNEVKNNQYKGGMIFLIQYQAEIIIPSILEFSRVVKRG